MKDLLEKQIESKVCAYARSRGFLAYKFNSEARRSVPDRLFISPRGYVFFIEFKRKGKKPTEAQHREIDRIREQGVDVFVVDDVDGGKRTIDIIVL